MVLHANTFSQWMNRDVSPDEKMVLHADSLSRSKNREVLWKVCKNLTLLYRPENICFVNFDCSPFVCVHLSFLCCLLLPVLCFVLLEGGGLGVK